MAAYASTGFGIGTLLLFACGFVFYFVDTKYPEYYQSLHSMWHIFAALGMTAGFIYFERAEEACRLRHMMVHLNAPRNAHRQIEVCVLPPGGIRVEQPEAV